MKKYPTYQLRNIDPVLWTRVKVLAASSGITIRQLIFDALKVYVAKRD